MIDVITMRSVQIYEFIKLNGFRTLLKEVVYWRRKAIVMMIDLDGVHDRSDQLRRLGMELIEVTQEILTGKKYHFAIKNRYLKALHYLEKGYGGQAIAKKDEIIGDIWHFSPRKSSNAPKHPDLDWLGIELSEDDAYCWDLFVMPTERGNNVSGILQNNAVYSLKQNGLKRAYGFCWADNVPAVWNARVVNKWKDIKTLKVSRFLFFKHVCVHSSRMVRSRYAK